MNKRLFLFFAFISVITMNIIQAQNNVRDKFLVETVYNSDSYGSWALSEYFYDADNKLIKGVGTGHFFEQGQWRYGKGVRIFEYENGRLSKIIYKDSTHFMFDYDTHFLYNAQGQIIRSEIYKNGYNTSHRNYHYENGRIVSIYMDGTAPLARDTIFYDDAGNVTKRTYLMGIPIPQWVTHYFEYDNNPRPNCGVDGILTLNPLPGLGTVAVDEMLLSKNNMTKIMLTTGYTLNYTYNEHGLPDTYEMIFEGSPPEEPSIFYITYKEIGVGVPEPEQELAEVKVYPNPTSGQLRITSYELRMEGIEVFDVFGRKVNSEFNIQNSEFETNISHLHAGIYFVRIKTDKGEVVRKIVKQ
ncbi:MAG: T9SS type A sorting domain-containing protein [Bacteroidetes bacterium]|nr:T9SS type A sorting domain-containing protein [Bacteroidota bacterium]MCL2303476.1 T9SS type A sorting domain-containing protein [Lentimicrobiaceae bacterium]